MKKIILMVVSAFVIIALLLYSNQGAFSDVVINQEKSGEKYMIGKYYRGNLKDEEFINLFSVIGKLKQENNIEGDLGAIYYNNPKNSKDTIEAFMGVIVPREPTAIESFEVRKIPEREVIKATLNASSAFVGKAYNAIFDHAEGNQIRLEDYYVEWFPAEDQIRVEINIAKND